MSSNPSSESNLRSLFETSLKEYEKQAGTNLLDNRLIVELRRCNSVDDIYDVLQKQAQAFHKFRGDNGKLTRWLKRTVNVLYTLSTSSALGAAVGLVCWKLLIYHVQSFALTFYMQPFPPANAIFAGIGVLLAVRIIWQLFG